MTIYLVYGHMDYEGSDVVAAFESKESADEFVKRCREYNETRETCPEDDDAFDAWYDRNQIWRKAHPAGPESGADYDCFCFASIEVQP